MSPKSGGGEQPPQDHEDEELHDRLNARAAERPEHASERSIGQSPRRAGTSASVGGRHETPPAPAGGADEEATGTVFMGGCEETEASVGGLT
jgi:hypothetical protein